MKRSANMHKNYDSQLFRINIRIPSGLDPLKESRSVMSISLLLVVNEILCSFRLALEGKASKEIPEP